MTSMFLVGTVCWVIACFFGTWYQYESRNHMTRKGMALKGIAAFCVVAYAIVLIAMFGQASEAAIDFVIGLALVAIADVLIAYLEIIGDGSSESLLVVASDGSNAKRILLSVSMVLYVCSFFLQMVAFIKGLSHYAVATDYVMPFIVFFFLPPIFSVLGGLLSRAKLPDTDMRVFIIAVFFVLLASALLSAGVVFALALFQIDIAHGTWVIFGSSLYFFAVLSIELRYAKPGLYDKKALRITSRLILFLGRMTLAGCAFLL